MVLMVMVINGIDGNCNVCNDKYGNCNDNIEDNGNVGNINDGNDSDGNDGNGNFGNDKDGNGNDGNGNDGTGNEDNGNVGNGIDVNGNDGDGDDAYMRTFNNSHKTQHILVKLGIFQIFSWVITNLNLKL